jgi:hypothetical protein
LEHILTQFLRIVRESEFLDSDTKTLQVCKTPILHSLELFGGKKGESSSAGWDESNTTTYAQYDSRSHTHAHNFYFSLGESFLVSAQHSKRKGSVKSFRIGHCEFDSNKLSGTFSRNSPFEKCHVPLGREKLKFGEKGFECCLIQISDW